MRRRQVAENQNRIRVPLVYGAQDVVKLSCGSPHRKTLLIMPPLLTKAEFTRLLAGRKTSFFVSINTSRPSFYL